MDRVRLGMVGGGQGAFIGAVHRIAARLDDAYTLVCGALSADPERARNSGAELGLDPARCYNSYAAMFAAERARADGMEVLAIVTPNHLHHPIASAALDAGFHVICDKPLVTSVELIERNFCLPACRTAVGALLARLGLTPQKPLQRAISAIRRRSRNGDANGFPPLPSRRK